MKVSSEHYIFPPRAKSVIPPSEVGYLKDLGYMAQLKYNDTHILVKYNRNWRSEKRIEFWDRHGNRLRSYQPGDELIEQLIEVGDKLGLSNEEWSLLDGGLLDSKHPSLRDTVVLWDMLVVNGDHLRGSTYNERYARLVAPFGDTIWYYTNPMKPDIHPPVDFGIKATDNIFMPKSYYDGWDQLFEIGKMVNAPFCQGDKISLLIEGIVLKDGTGKLESGRKEQNNGDWMVRSRFATGRHLF